MFGPRNGGQETALWSGTWTASFWASLAFFFSFFSISLNIFWCFFSSCEHTRDKALPYSRMAVENATQRQCVFLVLRTFFDFGEKPSGRLFCCLSSLSDDRASSANAAASAISASCRAISACAACAREKTKAWRQHAATGMAADGALGPAVGGDEARGRKRGKKGEWRAERRAERGAEGRAGTCRTAMHSFALVRTKSCGLSPWVGCWEQTRTARQPWGTCNWRQFVTVLCRSAHARIAFERAWGRFSENRLAAEQRSESTLVCELCNRYVASHTKSASGVWRFVGVHFSLRRHSCTVWRGRLRAGRPWPPPP